MSTMVRRTGFTIVELLIVIVVIAILASISVVAYNGIQSRANDVAVQADLGTFAKQMEMQKADLGAYPATLTSAMGFTFSRGSYGLDFQNYNVRYCYNSSNDSYILMANSKSGNYFKAQNGIVQSTASTYGWGVCTQIGLSSTNPSQNGLYQTTWSSWIN